MMKFTAMFFLLVIAGTVSQTKAQTSVNNINLTADATSPYFIEGISFTPDGILQNTESGGSKSVKSMVVT